MRPRAAARRGFTIMEVITALVIIGILGLAMTKLILGQTRGFQNQLGGRRARAAARSAMNILITDLRMTQDFGGVVAASADNRRIVVNVPVVFGIVCEVNAANVVLSLIGADTFQVASSKYGGYAVRIPSTQVYGYSAAGSSDTVVSVSAGRCHGGGVNIFADTGSIAGRAGRVVQASPAPPAGAVVGAPAFVYQQVVYAFRTSTAFPGRLGLYRTIAGRSGSDTLTEELIAPFGDSAKFGYFVSPFPTRDSAVYTVPGNLNNIRGFRIKLPAESADTTPGRTTPQRTFTSTAVFFKNTRNP